MLLLQRLVVTIVKMLKLPKSHRLLSSLKPPRQPKSPRLLSRPGLPVSANTSDETLLVSPKDCPFVGRLVDS